MMYRWTMLPSFPGVGGGGHLPRYILRPSESLNLIALGPASLLSLLTLPTLLAMLPMLTLLKQWTALSYIPIYIVIWLERHERHGSL